jgi:hypothetical protein
MRHVELSQLEAVPVEPLSSSSSPAVLALQCAVLAVETVLVSFLLTSSLPIQTIIGLHAGICAFVVAIIFVAERMGHETSSLQKFVFFVAVGGAIGGAAALIGEKRFSRGDENALKVWHDTIAPPAEAAVTLVDRILDGRLVRSDSALPRRFDHLLEKGSIREQQALLAYLASDAAPTEASDILRAALRSTDQRVRVQAAAVASHARAKARAALIKGTRVANDITVPHPATLPPHPSGGVRHAAE